MLNQVYRDHLETVAVISEPSVYSGKAAHMSTTRV